MATTQEALPKGASTKAKFGQLVVKAGYASKDQLKECLQLQKKYAKAGKKVPKIGELLVHKGLLDKDQVAKVLKKQKKLRGGAEAAQAGSSAPEGSPESSPESSPDNTPDNGAGDHSDNGAEPRGEASEEGTADEGEAAADEDEQAAIDRARAEEEEAASVPPIIPARREREDLPKLDIGVVYADEFMVEARYGDDMLGDCYIARQHGGSDRTTYLIVIDPGLTKDKTFKSQMLYQMKAMAKLDHPNIQKLYKAGKSNNCYYVALEFVNGDLAADKLKTRKAQEYSYCMKVWAQLVDALRVLEGGGICHGDISADNVMLSKDSATLLRGGLPWVRELADEVWVRLTPVYQAPEIMRGDAPDTRSDIFSLGVVMYHLMTGTAPFRADTLDDAIDRVEKGAPNARKHNGRIPNETADLIAEMMEVDSEKRPSDLSELKRRIAKLPQDIQTRVTMNYAAVLGEKALNQPSTSRGKAPESGRQPGAKTTQQARVPGSGKERKAGGSKSKKSMNYAQLVAQMNKDAAVDAATERAAGKSSQRTSLADLGSARGRMNRDIQGKRLRIPKKVMTGFLIAIGVVVLAAAGFYFYARHVQEQKNAEIRAKAAAGDGLTDTKNVGVALEKDKVKEDIRQNRWQIRRDRLTEEWEKLVDNLHKLKATDDAFHTKLEGMARQAVDLGDRARRARTSDKDIVPMGFTADAYHLGGRMEFYWAYTDRHGRIQASVKKDHVALANVAFDKAEKMYASKDATTELQLRVLDWMPEAREPQLFVAKRFIGPKPSKIDPRSARGALNELKKFRAAVAKHKFEE